MEISVVAFWSLAMGTVVAGVPCYLMWKYPPPPHGRTIIALVVAIPFFGFGTGSHVKIDLTSGKIDISKLQKELSAVVTENQQLQSSLKNNSAALAAFVATATGEVAGKSYFVNRKAPAYSDDSFLSMMTELPDNAEIIIAPKMAVRLGAKPFDLSEYGIKYKFIMPYRAFCKCT